MPLRPLEALAQPFQELTLKSLKNALRTLKALNPGLISISIFSNPLFKA